MINRRGRRFVDEGEDGAMFTYAKFGRAILAEPGAKAYQIFDSQVTHLLEPRYRTSTPLTADTLEALVEQMDIDDKTQAIKTLLEFNAAAHSASDGFDPTKKDGLSSTGLDAGEDELGHPAGKAAFRRLHRDRRDHLHLRRPESGRERPGHRHGLAADPRAAGLRRDDRRAVLRQLPGRDRPRFRRHIRPHRRAHRGAVPLQQQVDGGLVAGLRRNSGTTVRPAQDGAGNTLVETSWVP